MALPIEPTPCLDEKASRNFLARIEADLKVPTYSIPTPKIEEARKRALRHAVLGPKSSEKD